VVTREPGGTPIGEKIREVLLARQHGEMCNAAELLLYLAARAQHVAEKIRPSVEQGAVVLCDRFQEATFAYQGWGRGYDGKLLERLNAFATGGCAPDHTFILDIPVAEAFERMKKAGKTADRLEQNSMEFYDKIRRGYRALAAANAGRITLVDACGTIEQTAALICRRLDVLVSGRGKETAAG